MSLFLNMFKSKKKEEDNSNQNIQNEHQQETNPSADTNQIINETNEDNTNNNDKPKEKTFYIDESSKQVTQKGKFDFIKKKPNQTQDKDKEIEKDHIITHPQQVNLSNQYGGDMRIDEFLESNKESLRNMENIQNSQDLIQQNISNYNKEEDILKKSESMEISIDTKSNIELSNKSSSKQATKTKFGFIKKNKNIIDEECKEKEKEKEKEDSISDKLSITDSISKANQLKKDLINKEYKENKENKTDDIERIKEEKPQQSEVEILKKKCEEEIKKNNLEFVSIYQNINKNKEVISNINSQILKKEIEISSIEDSLQQTLKNEDFLKADEFENKKKYIYNKIEEHKDEIINYKKEIFRMKEKEIYTFRTFLKSYSDLSLSYAKLKSLASKDIDDYYQKDMSKFKNEQFIVMKLKEKLENLTQNLELKKEEIQQDNDFLEKLVKDQCHDIYEERDELKSKKEIVLNEVEELKRKLEEKLMKVDELNMEIEKRDNDIDAIKSNFKREYQKINNKKAKYDEDISDLIEENEKLTQMQRKLLENEENNKKKIEQLLKIKENYAKDMDKYALLSNRLNEQIEKKANDIKKENELNSKLVMLRQSYKRTEEMINFNKNEIALLELNIRNYENEISSLDLKVPSLEESKVKHVNSKNYKEAGKVSAELKRITELKAGLQAKIVENSEKIGVLSNEAYEKDVNLKEIDENISQCSIEIDKVTYINSIAYKESQVNLYNELKAMGDLINAQNLKKGIEQLKEEINKLKEKDYIKELIEESNLTESRKESKISNVDENNIDDVKDKDDNERGIIKKSENDMKDSNVINEDENEKNNEKNEKDDKPDKNDDDKVDDEEQVDIIEKKKTELNEKSENEDGNIENSIPTDEEIVIYKELILKIEKLGEELENAIQVEDYELADSLQSQIESETEVKNRIEGLYLDYFKKLYFENN